MTPEKLEKIAEYHDDMAKLYGVDDRPAGSEWFAEVAAFLRRLAAKMREPDGWACRPFCATQPYVTDHEEFEGDCRPILYLDSLEGDDE